MSMASPRLTLLTFHIEGSVSVCGLVPVVGSILSSTCGFSRYAHCQARMLQGKKSVSFVLVTFIPGMIRCSANAHLVHFLWIYLNSFESAFPLPISGTVHPKIGKKELWVLRN